MPYEIPTLGKLIADGEKDIAYELGLQKLPPVSVEQALYVSPGQPRGSPEPSGMTSSSSARASVKRQIRT
ncbi:hypothetical protein AWH00_12300 [Escherichia coli]|nr:hypothetical protein AWH00_12300 [Escherichia coli]